MDNKKDKRKEIAFLVCIFAISVIVRYIIGDYPKMIHVYRDELIYYDKAEAIAQGRGLLVRNTQTGMERLLYPLLISQAFLFSNRIIQGRIILLINTIVMSSSVIPVYLIAKRFLNKKGSYMAAFVAILMSDLTYTMTFMSENLYLPLTLWLIHVFTDRKENNKADIYRSAVCGALVALICYIKDVGFTFVPCFFVVYMYDIVVTEKKERKEMIKKSAKEFAVLVIAYGIVMLPHMIELFGRMTDLIMGNHVQAVKTMVTKESMNVAHENVLYAFVIQLIYYILAAGVAPVIFPIIVWKEMDRKQQRMCVLLYFMMLIMAFLVAASITVYDDLQFPFPRAHLRYVCYLWMPLLIVFFSLSEVKTLFFKKNYILALVIVALIMLTFKGAYEGTTIDQTMLYYENKVFNDHIWIYRAGVICGVMCLMLIWQKNRKMAMRLFIVVYCIALLSNNIIASLIHRKDYRVDDANMNKMARLEEFIDDKGEDMFIVVDDSYDDPQRLMDTFLNKKNVFFVSTQYIITEEKEGKIKLDDIVLYEPFYGSDDNCYKLDHVDYIIIRNDKGIIMDSEGLDKLTLGLDEYNMYKISNKNELPYIHY